ncbi:MAG TPA: hypothetical protein PK542_11775, partial [Treponemataceae bacterium]|nr:hypothetical protein [Treponemataceae bacterium]
PPVQLGGELVAGVSDLDHPLVELREAVEEAAGVEEKLFLQGQTAIVDPYGRIVAMAAPFTETALVGRIPVIETARRTPYRAWGDLWGVLFAASGSLALGVGLLTKLKNMYDN